jgi:hypothetical protein
MPIWYRAGRREARRGARGAGHRAQSARNASLTSACVAGAGVLGAEKRMRNLLIRNSLEGENRTVY